MNKTIQLDLDIYTAQEYGYDPSFLIWLKNNIDDCYIYDIVYKYGLLITEKLNIISKTSNLNFGVTCDKLLRFELIYDDNDDKHSNVIFMRTFCQKFFENFHELKTSLQPLYTKCHTPIKCENCGLHLTVGSVVMVEDEESKAITCPFCFNKAFILSNPNISKMEAIDLCFNTPIKSF